MAAAGGLDSGLDALPDHRAVDVSQFKHGLTHTRRTRHHQPPSPARGGDSPCRPDSGQHPSAVHQRIPGPERAGETAELPEPPTGAVPAVPGVTGDPDGDDLPGSVLAPAGAERGPRNRLDP